MHVQLVHAALDFFGGCGWVLWRDRDHAHQAIGVATHGRRQDVVGHRRKRHRRVFVHDLHAGRGQADDLHIHARFVHVLQAQIVQIDQTTHDVLRPFAGAAHVKTHQVLEAHIHIALGQDLVVDLQHLRRAKRLLGGNAAIRPMGQIDQGWAHGVSPDS